MESKLLTPLELKVMNILWRLKKAFVKEIIEEWPDEPIPSYNTVSTIVRILEDEKKGKSYVGHKAFGRSHQYYPLITKREYQQRLMKNVLNNAFSGSLTGMVSSLLNSQKVSSEELDALKKLIEESDTE